MAEETAKRQKLSDDNISISCHTSLNDICNWNYPHNTAIEYHDLTKMIKINYSELNKAKSTIQSLLKCLQNFEFIGINCDISALHVPSLMLGIVASGHAFVYLPKESTVRMRLLSELDIQYLFVHCPVKNSVNRETVTRVSLYGEFIYLVKHIGIKEYKKRETQLNHYAYAVATSGSTGIPKIIKVSNSCILPNIEDFKNILNVTETDKIAQLTNFTFDPSIIEIFLAFSSASTLFTISKELRNDPRRLLETIVCKNVTVLQMTPSVFFQTWPLGMIKSKLLNKESHLRTLLLGGEPLPKLELLSHVKDEDNATKIFNVYGITEVSCWSSINEIRLDINDPCDLGEPLSQTIFEVRDKDGKVVHEGKGSLFIGSDVRICTVGDETIANLKKPVFRDTGDIIAINGTGKIFYKGRKNRIIKRFGNKVDLQYLDNIISHLYYVQTCYSLWHEENHKLHLFVCIADNTKKERDIINDIMNRLSQISTLYKADKVHILESFKLTDNGKICTRFLEDQYMNEKNIDDENTKNTSQEKLKEIFKNIWMHHLKFINEGFMKLGGTSVAALQISTSITDALEVEFPELIGMLLRDSNFGECLSYLEARLTAVRIDNESTTTGNEAIFTNLLNRKNEQTVMINENLRAWQKCRGTTCANSKNLDSVLNITRILDIQIRRSYDLKKCIDASPTVFQYFKEKLYVVVGSHSGIICTIELEEMGNEYRINLPDRIEASVLVLHNFIGIVGCYDGCVYCLNLKTGQIIWKFQTEDVIKCTAIMCESQNVYFGSYDRHVYCLSSKDGSEIWKTKISSGSINATGSMHNESESVLFGSLDGSCVALQRKSGKIFWKRQLKDPIFVAPAVLRGGQVLFCTVAGNMCCFNIMSDQKIWEYMIDGNIFAYPLTMYDEKMQSERLVIASKNKNLYYLELTGTMETMEPIVKHIINCEVPIYSTPFCQDNIIIVACTNGKLLIFDIFKATPLASVTLPGDIFSSPVIYGNSVIVGCRDNKLYVLELVEEKQ